MKPRRALPLFLLAAVALIDAPVDFDDVILDVRAVSVHITDEDSLGSWHAVSTDSVIIHLLDLTNGVSALIGDADLPAGTYDQLRLLLGGGNLVIVDVVEDELTVPAGHQSGLKIHHTFDITDGETYDATIDIDVARSVHRTGNDRYMMRPVIRVRPGTVSGCIAGTVEPLAAMALVTAVSSGDSVQTFADPVTGDFRLMALFEGTYELTFESLGGVWQTATLADIEVTSANCTDIGTVTLIATPQTFIVATQGTA